MKNLKPTLIPSGPSRPRRNMSPPSGRPKLTCRAPRALAEQMKNLGIPSYGYRSQTEMYSHCLGEFIDLQPWSRRSGWQWTDAVNARALDTFHGHLEDVTLGGVQRSASALKECAEKAAEDAKVSVATFSLSFMWWIALQKHPPRDVITLTSLEPVVPKHLAHLHALLHRQLHDVPEPDTVAQALKMLLRVQAFSAKRSEGTSAVSVASSANYNLRMVVAGFERMADEEMAASGTHEPEQAEALQASMYDVLSRHANDVDAASRLAAADPLAHAAPSARRRMRA